MPSEALGNEPTTHAGARQQRLVWVLTAFVAAAAAAVLVPVMTRDPGAARPTAAGGALLVLFALAEVVVIHLPTRRNSHAYTLREVPAVLGLAFLEPQAYVWVYVAGAVAALVLHVRMRGVKLAFNAALYAFEAGLGVTVYHEVLQGAEPTEPRGWLAGLLAVLATDLISAAAVTTAISVTEDRFDAGVLAEALRSGVPAAWINTCLALLLVLLIAEQPLALVLLGTILVLVVLGYRAYVRLARGHARTQLLYRFVERTAAAQELEDVVAVALREARALMNAESAHLLELGGADSSPTARWHSLGDRGLVVSDAAQATDGAWWESAVHDGRPVVRTRDQQRAGGQGAPTEPRDGVAAPLPGREGVRGVLLVCDRAFEGESFGRQDAPVVEALAAHTAVALERADTVARLQRVAEERAHEALHDPLSGLPNRRAFSAAVADALHDQARGVLLLLDIDDFKDVNDTLGHSAGDRLISVTGSRLRDNASGLVARLGGDEFAVLLPGATVEEGLAEARRLRDALSRPVPLEDVNLMVAASVGVATYGPAPLSSDQLLAQADVAMYVAKVDRTGVAAYRPEVGDVSARRLALAADLPEALGRGDIELWYQPQLGAGSGAVVGFEALMRWRHPVFGMVPPPEVVAVAQRTGSMRQLTDVLMGQALSARRAWAEAGHALAVAVNVTPLDVADPALVGRVRDELSRTGTPPDALTLEITESDVMKDPEGSLHVLEQLQALGVTVSIDDFGTGYSSLSYLDRLPVGEVKIDRSFVARLEREGSDTIVSATITLAHDLRLRVVAEGVESEAAGRVLTRLGADLVQGYAVARPMPGTDVLGWLECRPHRGADHEASLRPASTPRVPTQGQHTPDPTP